MFKTTENPSEGTVCVCGGGSGGLGLGHVCIVGGLLLCQNCTNMVLYQEVFEVERLRPHFKTKNQK